MDLPQELELKCVINVKEESNTFLACGAAKEALKKAKEKKI